MKTFNHFTILGFVLIFNINAWGQLTGTQNIPGDYSDLASAIADLNLSGVGAGGVTINLLSGNPQIAPAGGYILGGAGSALLTSASVANPVTLQGNNNIITAPNPQTTGLLNDAIFKIIGADFIKIEGFVMEENVSNSITNAGTNDMTEWGIALLYTSVTDGAKNNTIQNNTISLNRNYQNTFGIYSNTRHSASAPTVPADITSQAGANDSLYIYNNSISNVNIGMSLVGGNVFLNSVLDVGGDSNITGNVISDYGKTNIFSSYPSVEPASCGILVSRTVHFNVSYNSVVSSIGGVTSGSLIGIAVPSYQFLDTLQGGVKVHKINNNNISLRSGVSNTMTGIINSFGDSVTTLSISNNNFSNTSHTVATSSSINFIFQGKRGILNTNINNNTFTNLNVNTTGSVSLITNVGGNTSENGTVYVTNNSIVNGFTKTGSGSLVNFYNSPQGTIQNSHQSSTQFINNNDISNVTVSGITLFNGIVNADGKVPSSREDQSGPTKIISGNVFRNIRGGSGQITIINVDNINIHSTNNNISNNNIKNISSTGPFTGITAGSSYGIFNIFDNTIDSISGFSKFGIIYPGDSSSVNIYQNTIKSGFGPGSFTGISCSAGLSNRVYKNNVFDISSNTSITGIFITSADSSNYIYNNFVGLSISTSAGNVTGISINRMAGHVDLFYNTVYLNAVSSGTNFSSNAINVGTVNIGPSLKMINNIFVNLSVPKGTGKTVAYRRFNTTLSNYDNLSDYNLFYAGTPDANHVIFYDGTNSDQTLAAYTARVVPCDANSTSVPVNFVDPLNGDLHLTGASIGDINLIGTPMAGITTDIDDDPRDPDSPYKGADEADGILPCTITASITPNGPTTFCEGGSVNLTSNAASSYLWSPGGETTQSITVSSAGSYTVTITDINNCTETSPATVVTVNPLPTVTVSPNVSVCSGTSTTLTGSGASSYEWSPSTGLNTTTGASVIANPTSTTTYTVTGTDANGCTNTAEVTVTVNPLPTVTVSSNVSICIGSSANLTAGGASSYEWSPSTGLNTTTGANVIANPSSTTTYIVTGTDANGCTNTAEVTVTVNPLPSVDAGADQSIYSGCLTQNATLTALVSGGNEPFTYSWSPGGETTQSITVSPSSTSTYTVTVTNASGCSSSDEVEVEVIPVSISVNAGDDQSIYGGCVTQSTTLTASASGDFGPSFLWSPGGETTQSITVSPSDTTTYSVTVTNTLGCSASDEVVVNVIPVSIAVNAGEDKSIFTGCVAQSSTITASVEGGFDPTYLWSPGGETTQTIVVNPSSTTTYTVTVTNSFGCSSSDQVVVNVTPVSLSVDAGSDTTIYLGYGAQSTTLTAASSGGYSPTYLWSPGGATTQSITVSPTTTTVYTVQVTNSIGCIATDELQVTVYDTRCGNNGNKVLVCHNGITICVSESAVSAHLDHGDFLDSCYGGPDNLISGRTINEIPINEIPYVYMLHANYPNPFNPVTTMKYDLPYDSKVTLKVYDMRGSEIATLVNGQMSAGYYTAKFNGENLPTGIYFYKLTATSGTEQYVKVMKMVLIK